MEVVGASLSSADCEVSSQNISSSAVASADMAVLLLATLLGAISSARPECSIPVNGDGNRKDPLISKSDSLATPDSTGHLVFSPGERIVVACPGKRNQVIGCQVSSLLNATCLYNQILQVDGKHCNATELACTNNIQGSIIKTNRRCYGNHGEIYELGFSIRTQWYSLVSCCHSNTSASTYFCLHQLNGSSIGGAEKQTSRRPHFDTGSEIGLYKAFSPINAYKQTSQKTVLTNILHSSSKADEYLSKTFLARGHLAPDADFPLNSHQHLTYFYINTAPQWQSVNGGNWVSLEKKIRKFAQDNNQQLSIATGTFGTLTLEDERNKEQQIFLYQNKNINLLPVPKYFWKVIADEKSGTGIAFVLVNNPYLRKIKLEDVICPNICDESKWSPSNSAWKNLYKGYVYCCDIKKLRNRISYIPNFKVNNILIGPH